MQSGDAAPAGSAVAAVALASQQPRRAGVPSAAAAASAKIAVATAPGSVTQEWRAACWCFHEIERATVLVAAAAPAAALPRAVAPAVPVVTAPNRAALAGRLWPTLPLPLPAPAPALDLLAKSSVAGHPCKAPVRAARSAVAAKSACTDGLCSDSCGSCCKSHAGGDTAAVEGEDARAEVEADADADADASPLLARASAALGCTAAAAAGIPTPAAALHRAAAACVSTEALNGEADPPSECGPVAEAVRALNSICRSADVCGSATGCCMATAGLLHPLPDA